MTGRTDETGWLGGLHREQGHSLGRLDARVLRGLARRGCEPEQSLGRSDWGHQQGDKAAPRPVEVGVRPLSIEEQVAEGHLDWKQSAKGAIWGPGRAWGLEVLQASGQPRLGSRPLSQLFLAMTMDHGVQIQPQGPTGKAPQQLQQSPHTQTEGDTSSQHFLLRKGGERAGFRGDVLTGIKDGVRPL